MKKRVKVGTSKAAHAAMRGKFVEAYLSNGGNATQAAISAGYSPKTAYSMANQLMKRPEIAAEIERRRAEVLGKAQADTELTVAGTLRELRGIVHSDLRQAFDPKTGALLPPHKWPDSLAGAMCSVKVVEMGGEKGDTPLYVKEVKVWDKNSGIEKAMKKLGLLIERKEIGEPGAFERLDDDELSRAAREADRIIAAAARSAGDDRKAGDRRRTRAPKAKA